MPSRHDVVSDGGRPWCGTPIMSRAYSAASILARGEIKRMGESPRQGQGIAGGIPRHSAGIRKGIPGWGGTNSTVFAKWDKKDSDLSELGACPQGKSLTKMSGTNFPGRPQPLERCGSKDNTDPQGNPFFDPVTRSFKGLWTSFPAGLNFFRSRNVAPTNVYGHECGTRMATNTAPISIVGAIAEIEVGNRKNKRYIRFLLRMQGPGECIWMPGTVLWFGEVLWQ